VPNRRLVLSSAFLLAVGLSAASIFATPALSAGQSGGPSLSLEEVDGGQDYYASFSNPLPSTPDYFPIGGWFRKAEFQSHFDAYRDFGMNTFVGVEAPEATSEALIRQAGMHAFIQADERTRFDDIGSETAGWLLADEIDMIEGPSACNGSLQTIKNGLPADGRARFNNYGKGVLLWETDAEAACFMNAQDITSTDLYWFTDPNQSNMFGKPWLPEGERQMTENEIRRAANYGYQVDRMRALDARDGNRQPIWNFVELGWPWTEPATNADRIQPAELRAAVWHSIIAGARGIVYFDHNFNGPCGGSTILGSCFPDTRAMAKSVNAQIQQLAPVLNSPTVTSGWTANPSIRAMVKWQGGHFYVFAGSRNNVSRTGRVSIPCVGDATAVRLGEAGRVPVSGGSFSDSFTDGNAIHIYRIDGGSTCGLPGPPPQSGSPPPAAPPNGFTFGKLKRNLKKGTAKLTAKVSAPGALRLKKTSRVRGASKRAAAGSVRLKISSRGEARSKLKRVGKRKRTSEVKVRAKVSYTPTGAEPNEKSKQVRLKRRHGQR
jgi:hypothetical protein